ncbi:MAG: radical SAM protein [Acidobacteriia bacterium]|nr:radical SAM protein [Terriglobia bacterium]
MSGSTELATTSRQLDQASRHQIQALPILILFPHNRCNCRCVMCDIWRIRQVRELTAQDLEPHLESIRRLGVRWVVFSGGEPHLHSDLGALAEPLRSLGIRITLLTAGLLLERYAVQTARIIDDVIVSLDGPAPIHNQIRGVPRAFELLARGVRALRELRPSMEIQARSTVQKANCLHLRATVRTAKELGLNSASFLAADLTSEAFNRPGGWERGRQFAILPGPGEVDQLEGEIERLISEHTTDIESGFIVENPDKLRRIVRHFRAHLGQVTAEPPRCNAPWVSAVIESDGTVRPCFFHRPIGNIRERPLVDVLNGDEALAFRQELNIASNPVCQKCVCSLYVPPESPSSPGAAVGAGASRHLGRPGLS